MGYRTGEEARQPFDARIAFRPEVKPRTASDPLPDNSVPNPFGTKAYPNLAPYPMAPSTEKYKFYSDEKPAKPKTGGGGGKKNPPNKTKTGGDENKPTWDSNFPNKKSPYTDSL